MTITTKIINSLIGLPWKKGGRTLQEGFDCWGFFKYFYNEFLNININYDYPYKPGETKKIVSAFNEATSTNNWLKLKKPEPYCAMTLSMNKKMHHVGIYYAEGCLHCAENVGVVYNSFNDLKRNGYNTWSFYKCTL